MKRDFKSKSKVIILTCFCLVLIGQIKAQSCAKVDKVDDFSGIRIVETHKTRVYGASVASLALTNSLDWGYYIFFTLKGNELFFSLSDEGQYHSTTSFDSISLKLLNDTIITMKNFHSDGAYEGFNNYNYEKSHSKINRKIIDVLSINDVMNIRFYIGNATLNTKVNNTDSDRIMKFASCIISYLPAAFGTGMDISTTNNLENRNANLEPQPTNDTTSISLFKQWKLVASLDSAGVPIDLKATIIIRFNNNGTYTTIFILKGGKSSANTGKYQLLNDNKLIIFTPDNNSPASSAAITKFTKTELILKTQKNQSLYAVY